MVCTLLAGVNVVAFAADDNDLIEGIHSVYNDAEKGGDGEHLYTKDHGEISWLVSLGTWNDEDVAWNAPVSSSTAIWRCYNPNSGEHLYVDEGYADYLAGIGWNKEKLAFYSDDDEGVPVYRLWNGQDGVGSHYFTTDAGEVEWLEGLGWTLEDVAFFGVKEEGEKEMVATQTGANEITVATTEDLTELEEFTVMKGSSVQTLADDPVFLDENTVILTLNDDITADEYTVICSDEEYLPAVFYGEVATLTTVEIADELIPVTVAGKNQDYNVFVETLDQFGDDFVVDDWDGKVITNGTFKEWDSELGVLTITSPNVDSFKTGDTTSISLIEGTFVATETATYSNPSVPALITVSSVKMTEAETLKNQTGRIDVDDLTYADDGYYFEVTALDQYGLPLDALHLNAAVGLDYLVVSDGSKVITPSNTAAPFTDTEDGVVMYIESGSGLTGQGTISLIPVANTAGAATATLDVVANEKIESITVSKALDNLQVDKAVPVLVTAVNQYGEAVDFEDEVVPDPVASAGTDSVTLAYTAGSKNSHPTSATMSVTGGEWVYNNATYPGIYSIEADDQTIPFVMVVTTGLQTKQFSFTPDAKAAPAGIYGLSEDIQTSVAYSVDTGAAIMAVPIQNVTNVLIKDQYGDEFGHADVFNGTNTKKAITDIAQGKIFYTVNNSGKPTALKATDTGLRYMDATTNTGAQAVHEKFVINAWIATEDLGDGDDIAGKATSLGSYNFTVTEAGKEYVNFLAMFVDSSANPLPKDVLYSGANFDKAQLVVYGFDAQGTMIPLVVPTLGKLDALVDIDGFVEDSKATLAFDDDSGVLTVTTPEAYDPEDADDATASVELWYAGVYVDTIDIEVSNVPSQPEEFVSLVKIGDAEPVPYDLSKGLTVSPTATIKFVKGAPWLGASTITITDAANDAVYTITTEDQYGLSSIDKVVYAGGNVDDAGAATNVQAGSKTLSIKAGLLSQNVVITVPQA